MQNLLHNNTMIFDEFEDIIQQLLKLDYFEKKLLSNVNMQFEDSHDSSKQNHYQFIKDLKSLLLTFKNKAYFYSNILENQRHLICHFRKNLTITYVNQFFCKFFNIDKAETVNTNFRQFISDTDADKITDGSSFIEFHTIYDIQNTLQDNAFDKKMIYWRIQKLSDEEYLADGTDFTEIYKLKTELKNTEQYVQIAISHDVLTGLLNRHSFVQRIYDEIDRSKKYALNFAILLFDIDDFKKINDTLGHDIGDSLLLEVSKRLKQIVRASDVVARIGGDEFALMLPTLKMAEGATVVANKILNSFSHPFVINEYEFYLTTSIGIALYPNNGTDAETLLKNADAAMYEVKKLDKNSFQFYDIKMNASSIEKLKIENELHKALENEEFVLFYQPQIEIKTGKMVGVEALIRWMKPGVGLVPPLKFIPVAEETNLIIPISEWVIKTACLTNMQWLKKGLPPITIAVNISMKHFKQPHLYKLIDDCLTKFNLSSDALEMELTESILMHDTGVVIKLLNQFRELGLKISIDDFGTGYSSLSYLKKLPITKLKVDQSFVRNITIDKKDAMIVKTIIEMAHNLDLKVIAEGVETAEHSEFLRKLECDELQGYFFSRPIPQNEFEQLWQTLLKNEINSMQK